MTDRETLARLVIHRGLRTPKCLALAVQLVGALTALLLPSQTGGIYLFLVGCGMLAGTLATEDAYRRAIDG